MLPEQSSTMMGFIPAPFPHLRRLSCIPSFRLEAPLQAAAERLSLAGARVLATLGLDRLAATASLAFCLFHVPAAARRPART